MCVYVVAVSLYVSDIEVFRAILCMVVALFGVQTEPHPHDRPLATKRCYNKAPCKKNSSIMLCFHTLLYGLSQQGFLAGGLCPGGLFCTSFFDHIIRFVLEIVLCHSVSHQQCKRLSLFIACCLSHICAPCLNCLMDLDAILQVHFWGSVTQCFRWGFSLWEGVDCNQIVKLFCLSSFAFSLCYLCCFHAVWWATSSFY